MARADVGRALVEMALKKSLPRKLKPTLTPVVARDMTMTPPSISQASLRWSDSTQKGFAICGRKMWDSRRQCSELARCPVRVRV